MVSSVHEQTAGRAIDLPAVRYASPLLGVGQAFFAIGIIAFGVLHLVYGDFVTRVVVAWPEWIPGRSVWVAAVGVGLVVAGLAILAGKQTVQVATLLGSLLLLSFAFLSLPLTAADSLFGGSWTRAGKALALSGGAFLVAQSAFRSSRGVPDGTSWVARLERLWALGPWFFGAFLTLCGIQHFIHVTFVMSLVPTWIPGALFWTYFAGVALIAGGVGVVVPRTSRLAGWLSGIMIFLWVVMLHIPRAVAAATGSSNETTAVFEALAMSGIAFLIAGRRQETGARS